jgi:hypothetical protein
MPTSRRFSSTLTVMFGVIIAIVAFAVPASAAPYVTAPATSVSNAAPAAGSSLKFCGSGFQPGETVTIAMDDGTTFPSATAGTSGAFCSTLVLGASLTGTHTITATGATSARTSSTTIKVAGVAAAAPAADTTDSNLAFTGAAVIGVGALGGLLLVGGAVMVFAGRRRKVNASDL